MRVSTECPRGSASLPSPLGAFRRGKQKRRRTSHPAPRHQHKPCASLRTRPLLRHSARENLILADPRGAVHPPRAGAWKRLENRFDIRYNRGGVAYSYCAWNSVFLHRGAGDWLSLSPCLYSPHPYFTASTRGTQEVSPCFFAFL